jgi:hypothetical protein
MESTEFIVHMHDVTTFLKDSVHTVAWPAQKFEVDVGDPHATDFGPVSLMPHIRLGTAMPTISLEFISWKWVPSLRLWADSDKDDNEDIIADLNTFFARPASNEV